MSASRLQSPADSIPGSMSHTPLTSPTSASGGNVTNPLHRSNTAQFNTINAARNANKTSASRFAARTCDQDVQTECVLYPTVPPYRDSGGNSTLESAMSMLSSTKHQQQRSGASTPRGIGPIHPDNSLIDQHSALHAKSYTQLLAMRSAIQNCMDCVGGGVYDLLSYKDIILQLSDRLPDVPVTDLTLIASKLYRYGGDLSSLLQTFFQSVFADGFVDESFHFVHMRLMKAEVSELRGQVEKLTLERDDARERYREISQGMEQHAVAIETLENRNDVLELRSSALEDQMALLFGQLSDDFLFYNESLLTRTTDTLDIHKELSAPRSVFSQNIDGVQKRLLHFQSLLNDIQQDSKIMNGADGGTIKAKVKQLEHHVQQLYARFSSVKEGLMSTSEELLSALADKKKILNFCCEHIRLYDLQNQKLRNGRAELHELRQRISVVERCVAETLASGQALSIDRNGDINYNNNNNISADPRYQNNMTSPTSSTYGVGVSFTDTSLRRHQLASIKELQEQLLAVQDSANTLTLSLDGTNEQKQLLRAISLSTPSTRKSGTGGGASTKGGGVPLPHVGGGEVGVGGAKAGGHHLAPKSAGQLLVALQSQLGRVRRLDGGSGGITSGGNSRRESRMMGHPGMTPLGDSSTHLGTSRTHTLPSRRESSSMASRLGSGVLRSASSNAHGEGAGVAGASPLEINNLKREFLRKLVFMKNIYESRISELEERVDSLLKQVSGKQQQPPQQPIGRTGGGGGANASASIFTSSHQHQHHQYFNQPLWTFMPDPDAMPHKNKSPPRDTKTATSVDFVEAAVMPQTSNAGYMPPLSTPMTPTADPTGGDVDVDVVDAQVRALEGLGGGGDIGGSGKPPAPLDPDQLAATQALWASTRQELHEYVGSLRGGIPLGEDDEDAEHRQSPITIVKVRSSAPVHRNSSSNPRRSNAAGGASRSRRGMGVAASPHPPRSASLGRSMGSSGMGSPAGRGGVHYAPEEGEGDNTTTGGEEATISIYSVADSRTYALSVLNTLVRGTRDPGGDSQAASFSVRQRR